MKNKAYSSKFATYFSIVSIGIFTVVEIIGIYLLITNLIDGENILFAVVMVIGFLSILLLCIFMGNRFGYTVTYDIENEKICRSGLIFGYKYQVKVDDIKDIIIATFPKETTYFILIDSNNTKYDGGFKKSFIRLEKTEKNYQFIMQFWNKPIKNV